MIKKLKHVEWFRNAGVYFNEERLMQINSTKPKLNVDVWSGNHPFYNNPQGFKGEKPKHLKKQLLIKNKNRI